MFEEKAQSYRVKDKEIYRVKLACQNTKVYRVNTQLTKGTIMLLYFFCFFLHMRTLSVLDKYRANVLGPCRARAITLFTVIPWRVTNTFTAWLEICNRFNGLFWYASDECNEQQFYARNQTNIIQTQWFFKLPEEIVCLVTFLFKE